MIKRLGTAKKVAVTGIGSIIIVAAGVIFYLNRAANTYTVINYEPAACTQDIPTSACTDAYVTVRAADGTTKVFSYNGLKPPKFENTSDDFNAFKQGNKIQLTTSGDTVLVVKIVN